LIKTESGGAGFLLAAALFSRALDTAQLNALLKPYPERPPAAPPRSTTSRPARADIGGAAAAHGARPEARETFRGLPRGTQNPISAHQRPARAEFWRAK